MSYYRQFGTNNTKKSLLLNKKIIMNWLKTALGFISPAAASYWQVQEERKQNQAQRQWASSEAEKAYQRNLEQWNRENQYNDPSAKMARLKQAGLNPNLAYGNPQTAGVSASSPQKQAPKGRFENPTKNINPLALANASLMQQQARSVQLDNYKKEHDLGLRDEGWKTETVQFLNPDTNKWEIHMEVDTKNWYVKKIRRQYEALKYDTEVKALEASLAKEGFVKGDNAIIRFLATALKAEGISPNQITQKIVQKIINKLY